MISENGDFACLRTSSRGDDTERDFRNNAALVEHKCDLASEIYCSGVTARDALSCSSSHRFIPEVGFSVDSMGK